jgi:predicted O-linked N-acetylglucosamine transferase (SPINDLY family)
MRGIGPEKVIFTERLDSYSDHLGRYVLADVFLDTFPYGAHTTISDAIWSGLPVITQRGRSFQSRIAYSVMGAMGLQKYVATNQEEYINLAIRLANEPHQLSRYRELIKANRTKLTDIKEYVDNFESLYKKIYSKCIDGEALNSIECEDYLNGRGYL